MCVCLSVCYHFSRQPRVRFFLKFGMVVDNTVGHQAKLFGANWINTFRVILNLVAKKEKNSINSTLFGNFLTRREIVFGKRAVDFFSQTVK